ncbi:MAG: YceI family protein [Desertimonas sp.]
MNTQPPRRSRSRRQRLLLTTAAVVVVLGLAFAAFAWWFLRDDAPDEVSLDNAAAQVTTTTVVTSVVPIDTAVDTAATAATEGTTDGTEPATTVGATDMATASAGGEVTGTWTVDTSIGEFSYENSTGTFVGFRIAEELSGVGETEAVGRTPTVSGTLTIEGSTITEVTIEADMTAITTNESRRDDRVQSALDTGEFPTATFVLTTPIEMPESATAGAAFTVDATGELTIHGVTQTVTFPLDAQLVDDTIVVVGSLEISFADYGVEVPSAPVVVSAEDHGPIELQLFFTR